MEAPSRVLVCTQGFPRNADDHHTPFLLDHARALVMAGAEVTVLCPSGPGLPGHEVIDGVDVVRFRYAPRPLEALAYTGAMHRAARGWRALLVPLFLLGFLWGGLRHARRADVLHAHWWIPSGLIAVVVGRVRRLPVVVHLHGTDVAIAGRLLRPLARVVLRRAGAVLAVGPDLVAWGDAVANVSVTLAPMPLPVHRLAPPAPAPEAGPVLAVGRLVPEKGFDVLIRAVAQVGLPLVLVGEGDQRPALEGLTRLTGADVSFTGAVSPERLRHLYASARLVAVPSRREGFGMVAAEALACGRAVVASSVGGLRTLVHDGVNGRLVPPDDVDALAGAMTSISPSLGEAGPASVAWLAPLGIGQINRAAHRRAAEGRPPSGR